MNKAIVILSVVLVVMLVLAALLYFGDKPSEQNETATEPTTTAPTQTDPPTTEPPTTEPPTTTEPEPVIEASGRRVVWEGKEIETFCIDGEGTLMALASSLSKESEEEYIPLLDTANELGYPIWEDPEDGTIYITPSAKRFEILTEVNVPVLMYHAVSDNMWGINELFVSPSDMEEQLKYLVDNGYDPIWFEDLAYIESYDKPVILTFDDGYDDNYTELFPLLQEYNVKATIFVIGNAPGTSHKMTAEQIKELSDSGLISIQSHGYTHHDMNVMDEETLEYELGETWRVLTRITGKIPSVLCYPTGRYSDTTLEVAQRYYNFGLKMNGGLYNTSDDPYLVNRYYIARYTDIYTFAAYISNAGT